ncbi:MAG: hypothetical protein ABI378_01870 [Chitinophagaceae bacterium]
MPETLPSRPEIEAAIRAWPWFVPLRLMEMAALQLENKDSVEARNLHYLYCPNAVTFATLSKPMPKQTAVQEVGVLQEKIETIPVKEAKKVVVSFPENPVENIARNKVDQFFAEASSEDYFLNQGIELSAVEEIEAKKVEAVPPDDPKTLMVMMSFADWLAHFKHKSQKEEEEAREKSALRSMWQQERLAAALQEESEEIPEQVFTMAVNSITREDDIISEALAKILEKQEKWDAAAEMYQKLGLKNPSKSAYFASRAEAAKKRLQQ